MKRVRQPSLREEHKLVTRARIRRSARLCFGRDGVRNVSLEQIAQEAGIGRTTLYQYYPSKPDLLFDLMEQSLRASDRVFQKLAQIERVDAKSVKCWLDAYLAEVRDHAGSVEMFNLETAQDDRARQLMRNHWARTTAILGKRFARFDLTGLAGDELVRCQYAAETLLGEIEQFCGAASLGDYHLDRAVVIDFLAERIVKILRPGRASGRASSGDHAGAVRRSLRRP